MLNSYFFYLQLHFKEEPSMKMNAMFIEHALEKMDHMPSLTREINLEDKQQNRKYSATLTDNGQLINLLWAIITIISLTVIKA